jgi:hypothetical protein
MDRRYKKKMAAYWISEENKSRKTLENLDYLSWFNLWHTHPDWNSKGNRCIENRTAVAELSYRLLQYAEQLASVSRQSIQIFAILSHDTGNSAVYIHTENPYGTPYPLEFKEALWDLPAPTELSGIVNLETHAIGRIVNTDSVEYIIKKIA